MAVKALGVDQINNTLQFLDMRKSLRIAGISLPELILRLGISLIIGLCLGLAIHSTTVGILSAIGAVVVMALAIHYYLKNNQKQALNDMIVQFIRNNPTIAEQKISAFTENLAKILTHNDTTLNSQIKYAVFSKLFFENIKICYDTNLNLIDELPLGDKEDEVPLDFITPEIEQLLTFSIDKQLTSFSFRNNRVNFTLSRISYA